MIAEIIFSDYYRTFVLCVLSIGLAFSIRNASNRKKALALAGYELIVILIFFWILILCAIFTEFDMKSMIAIAKWGLKWILYFTINMILQFMDYHYLWKGNKVLKAVTLLVSIAIAGIPLCLCNFE